MDARRPALEQGPALEGGVVDAQPRDFLGAVPGLFERGGLGDNRFRTASLTLVRFDLEWLTDGKDSLEKRNR